MFRTFSFFPLPFWVVVALLVAGACRAWPRFREGTGLPTIVVLGTVATWYVGDAFYNGYHENYQLMFPDGVLDQAWWEVALCLTVFLFLVNPVHRAVNRAHRQSRSWVYLAAIRGGPPASSQEQLKTVLSAALSAFALLSVWAAVRLGPEIVYYYCPYLGHKAEPWGRDRIGGGIDALLSLAGYIQSLVACVFGIVAALSNRGKTRGLALAGCFLLWPCYFFDRTRGSMLFVALPGVLCWVFLRLRASFLWKAGWLCVLFLGFNIWFKFVLRNRSQMTITQAYAEQSVVGTGEERAKHEGLNMYEELCWINLLMGEGTYKPNWGRRYFSEVVNPIPRSLWHGKPLIGIDYALARGLGGGEEAAAGVVATFSTGMIGQGVVNFGRVLGPAFVGLLVSLWAALLARFDLTGDRVGRLPLYALGMVLTFNCGRDITLLNLYPFAFGWFVVWALERRPARGGRTRRERSTGQTSYPGRAAGAVGLREPRQPYLGRT